MNLPTNGPSEANASKHTLGRRQLVATILPHHVDTSSTRLTVQPLAYRVLGVLPFATSRLNDTDGEEKRSFGGGRGGSRRPRGLLTPHSARPRSIWEHGSPSGRRGGDSCAVAAHAKCTWVRVCSCGRRAAHNSVSGAGESGAVCGRGVRAKAAVECLMLSTHTHTHRERVPVCRQEKNKKAGARGRPQA